jgi:hypothetical protein
MHGGRWHVVPGSEIDVDSVMSSHFKFDPEQDILEGALVYRIQRRQYGESDNSVQDESKYIQLLIDWRVEHTSELYVRALLVEPDKELDEDKLRVLHQKYWYLLKARVNPIKNNLLLNDAIVLTVAVKAMNGGYRWDIHITKGVSHNVKRPIWIDTAR